MSIVYVLLPLSILLAVVALVAYLWGVRRGQFDDLETPAIRILFDEDDDPKNEKR